jgi:hypothetical protein
MSKNLQKANHLDAKLLIIALTIICSSAMFAFLFAQFLLLPEWRYISDSESEIHLLATLFSLGIFVVSVKAWVWEMTKDKLDPCVPWA